LSAARVVTADSIRVDVVAGVHGRRTCDLEDQLMRVVIVEVKRWRGAGDELRGRD
jgi:hypothetical protein